MKYEIKALNIRDKKVNCELHGMAGQMWMKVAAIRDKKINVQRVSHHAKEVSALNVNCLTHAFAHMLWLTHLKS